MTQATSPSIQLEDTFLADHEALFKTLVQDVEWDTSMRARHTASFGEPYDYSQMSYPRTVIPPFLEAVRTQLLDVLGVAFNNCLLNYYHSDSSSMGYHSDDTSNLRPGTGVAIVSLGGTRELSFRRIDDRDIICTHSLVSGSLLYMDDHVQRQWKHAIRKQPGTAPRISLTWRAFV